MPQDGPKMAPGHHIPLAWYAASERKANKIVKKNEKRGRPPSGPWRTGSSRSLIPMSAGFLGLRAGKARGAFFTPRRLVKTDQRRGRTGNSLGNNLTSLLLLS